MASDAASSKDKGFFSNYPRFRDSSSVASSLERLDFRYNHVIAKNSDLIDGARVLDIASHDARFAFAAIRGANAKHVIAIEARDTHVAEAKKNLDEYEVPEDRYDLVLGDVFEEVKKIEKGSIDTVLILGFLYHTARQYELISMISEIGAKNIIVDSNVLRRKRPIIRLKWEKTDSDGKIWNESRKRVLSSTPTAMALEFILREFGYETEILKVEGDVPQPVTDYKNESRVTIVARRE